jgi:hypothetical protein
MNIHMCGGGDEIEFEKIIMSQVKHSKRVISHIGKTSLSDWSAIVQHADLEIGNDSATMHLAAASRRKAICIAGVYDKYQFFPYKVDMLEEGLFRNLFDVQCFDLKAVESYRNNPRHQGMSGSMYGNPHNKGAVVNNLDIMILGATEIDTDFNVNVTTGSSGVIMGGSGGHSDTAAGAKLAIVVMKFNILFTTLIGRLPLDWSTAFISKS